MADTTFQYGQLVEIGWMQDVNNAVYRAIGSGGTAPTTPSQVIANLNLAALFANISGSASNTFLVANSSAGTNQAIPRVQADALYASAGSGVLSFNTRTGAVTLTSTDVTNALGFTPANASNVVNSFNSRNGTVTLLSSDIVSALGYTPANAANVVNTISAGSTGLTPSSATNGVVTLSGVLNVAHGGTGVTTSTGSGSVVLNTGASLSTPTVSDRATFTAQASNPSASTGVVWYDQARDALSYYNSANYEINIGQQVDLNVYNNTGSTLAAGTAVYFSGGSTSGFPNVAAAIATSISSSNVVGVLGQSISNGSMGTMVALGGIYSYNTTGMSSGAALFLSPTTAGALTTTQPSSPFYAVRVGYVVVGGSSTGTIFISKSNAYTLGSSIISPVSFTAFSTTSNVLQLYGYSSGQIADLLDIYTYSGGTKAFAINASGAIYAGVWNGSTIGVGYGGTGVSTTPANGALLIGNGSGYTSATLTAGSNITITNSAGGITIASTAGGSSTISNDTTTSTPVYPLFAHTTSGTATTIYTGNPELLYTPSTGTLASSQVQASNGLILNNTNVNTSFTIPSGQNAVSVGPMTVTAGQSVTVTAGQRWVIL